MAAPALIALAHGSRDPRSAATVTALVDEVRALRPDLRVEAAFLELVEPASSTVVDRLVQAGHDEIVVVPLLLDRGLPRHGRRRRRASPRPPRATPACRSAPPPSSAWSRCFLEVLDVRMREALEHLAGARARRPGAGRRRLHRRRWPTSPWPGWPGCGAPTTSCPSPRRSPRPRRRPPARPCGPSAPRAGATSPSPRCSWPPAACSTGPPSWPSRPAPSRSPRRWAPTPRSPAPILARYAVGAVELVPV